MLCRLGGLDVGLLPWNTNPEPKMKSWMPSSWEAASGAFSCSRKPFGSNTPESCCSNVTSRSVDYGRVFPHGRPSRTIRSISASRDLRHARTCGRPVTCCTTSPSMRECKTCSPLFAAPTTWSVVPGQMTKGAGCCRSTPVSARTRNYAAANWCSAREGMPGPLCLRSTPTAVCRWSTRAKSTNGRRPEDGRWSSLVVEPRPWTSA